MRYWFVNIGKKYNEQRNGGYLWAPLKNKRGKKLAHWLCLQNVKKGDVIFCNYGGIRTIAIAKDLAYLAKKPTEFKENWNPDGRKLDVEYFDLNKTFNFKIYKDYILNNIEDNENPFNRDGNAKQQYLSPLDENIAKFFISKINNSRLEELILLYDSVLEDEIQEYCEEQEQFEKINNGSIRSYTQ